MSSTATLVPARTFFSLQQLHVRFQFHVVYPCGSSRERWRRVG